MGSVVRPWGHVERGSNAALHRLVTVSQILNHRLSYLLHTFLQNPKHNNWEEIKHTLAREVEYIIYLWGPFPIAPHIPVTLPLFRHPADRFYTTNGNGVRAHFGFVAYIHLLKQHRQYQQQLNVFQVGCCKAPRVGRDCILCKRCKNEHACTRTKAAAAAATWQ